MPLRVQPPNVFLLAWQFNMQGQIFTFDDPAYGDWNVSTLQFLVSGTPAETNYLANMPCDIRNSLSANWMNP